MLLQALIHLSVLIFKAEIDRWNIKRGAEVPHKLWVCLLAPITIYTWLPHYVYIFIHASLYWIIFDIYLNLRRGLKWDYIGEGAEADKFLWWFRKRKIHILVPKIALLIVSIGLYWIVDKYY